MPSGGGADEYVRGRAGVIGDCAGESWQTYEPVDDALMVNNAISIGGNDPVGPGLTVTGGIDLIGYIEMDGGPINVGPGESVNTSILNVDTVDSRTAPNVTINSTTAVIGDLNVTGAITTMDKSSFLIDHPVEPETKSLKHSCIEGPEHGVYYRGEAELVNGEAVVELPDYFEALTGKEERTVFLTAKGDEPYLLSASEVSGGKFKAYGTKPDGEFYWEVKAVRGDLEPLEVEVLKE